MQSTPKLLIACPTCQLYGRKQILGEIKDGMFIIMRFHNGFTKVRGEFEVICDKCSEPVYFKTHDQGKEGINYGTLQMLNHGLTRVHWAGTLAGTN